MKQASREDELKIENKRLMNIQLLAQYLKCDEQQAEETLNQIVQHITALLGKDMTIQLPDVGVLQVAQRKEHVVVDENGTRTLMPPALFVELQSTVSSQDKSTSHEALNALAAAICEVAEQKETVTVSKLGTFCKRVQAKGNAFSFTADEELNATVNAPFQFFKPIILKEGVQIPDTEELIPGAEQETTTQLETAEDISGTSALPLSDSEPEEITPAEEPKEEEVTPAEELIEEEEEPAEEPKEEDEQPSESEIDIDTISKSQDVAPSVSVPINVPVSNPAVDNTPASIPDEGSGASSLKKVLFIAGALIAALLVFLLIRQCSNTAPEEPPAPKAENTVSPQQLAKEKKQQLITESNKEVEWAPYEIVDIYDTITVEQPTTATNLALTYGGPGTEYYIRAINKNKEEYQEGDNVIIPLIEKKKKR